MGMINEIKDDMRRISEAADQHTERLTREEGYILETISKLQTNFGEQQAGKEAIRYLYSIKDRIGTIKCYLEQIKTDTYRVINGVSK